MKKLFVLIVTVILMGVGIVGAEMYLPVGSGDPAFSVPSPEIFKVIWREKEKCLEVIGKNIHLRIYECGKVEKLQWKEINKNEEGNPWGNIRITPYSYLLY